MKKQFFLNTRQLKIYNTQYYHTKKLFLYNLLNLKKDCRNKRIQKNLSILVLKWYDTFKKLTLKIKTKLDLDNFSRISFVTESE